MIGQLVQGDMSSILSICVPTYNRRDLLDRLMRSCESALAARQVSLVIADDGSTDGTNVLVSEWMSTYPEAITYSWAENAGRATALLRALRLASQPFTVVMDSDDYFVDGGIARIVEAIGELPRHPGRDVRPLSCLVFPLLKLKGTTALATRELPQVRSNFIALRADHSLGGDLKEVVPTAVMQQNLYTVPPNCRRVPTSLLWSRIAITEDCLFVPSVIAVKEYLPEGMSDTIDRLKVENPLPLVWLYALLEGSTCYHSSIYRWRSRFLWCRYAHHARSYQRNAVWKWLLFAPSLVVATLDRRRVLARKRRGEERARAKAAAPT